MLKHMKQNFNIINIIYIYIYIYIYINMPLIDTHMITKYNVIKQNNDVLC